MSDHPRHVLVAGGGVAALEAALAMRALAEDRVAVEVLAPESEFTYRPLAVAEPFRVGEARRFPLKTLVEAAGATLRQGKLESVDAKRREVTTGDGETLAYDALLMALGAQTRPGVPGALTFRGPQDEALLSSLLSKARTGHVRKLVFALPVGVTWALPLYELALLTAVHLADAGVTGVQLELVTPEERPLQLFGSVASEVVSELLGSRGIALRTDTAPMAVENGSLRLAPQGRIEADRVVALPRLEGPRLAGVPHNASGFVRTNAHGRVAVEGEVYAAGDLTDFPVKQGGLAAQQADAAAESIAAGAGAAIEPKPFTPVLRGLLLTGLSPRYLRAEPGKHSSIVETEPLWWPPAKIVGRHLAPFLAAHMGLSDAPPRVEEGKAIEIEVELDPRRAGSWSSL
ncbi:MAG TPA: FAD-dependent oxidoreductase [Gaiellaceae bacterium]